MKTSERTLCRWISADGAGQRKTHKKSEPSLISMARSLFVIASCGFLFRAMTLAVTIRKGAEVKGYAHTSSSHFQVSRTHQ
jgi:hypothetical protein